MDLLYPGSGYSSETGGKLKNLRTLSNAQVTRYHRENYTPDNVLFVLSGNVSPDEFLKALDLVETSIKSKPSVSKIDKRPWMGPVPPMDLTVVGCTAKQPGLEHKRSIVQAKEVSFPSEDESRGNISIAWRGPTYEQRQTWVALQLLWEYLTDSASSPLQKAFVECEEPLCAGVYPAQEIFTEGYHQLWFQEVEVEKMDAVIPKFFEALEDAKQNWDMERMKMVIRRSRRQILEYSERKPTNTLIDGVIRSFLYGLRGDDGNEMANLKTDADQLSMVKEALKLTNQEWLNLLDEFVLTRPYGLVKGKPSAELAKTMAESEKARETKQAEDLGPEKLKELGEVLTNAIEFNERPIPEKILRSVPVPSLDKVKPVPVLTLRGVAESVDICTNSGKGVSKEDTQQVLSKLRQNARETKGGKGNLFHVDWNHIESAFLTVGVGLSTKELTTKQRLYLPLLEELAFKLPAKLDDGSELSKDAFVSQLQDDTVSYSARTGLFSGIPQMISFRVQVENEPDKGMQPALKWIRRALYLTTINSENVKMTVQRLLSEIPTQIRSGPTMLRAVSSELNYDPSVSNVVAGNTIRQWPFLEELKKKIMENDEAEAVVQELNELRKDLVQLQNMQVFVAGNLLGLSQPMETLSDALVPPGDLTNGQDSFKMGQLVTGVSASTVRSTESGRAVICPLSAIESSFLSLTCPGVGSYDPNQASLLVAIEYLTALEGDFWVKLRGAGLTYGSSISNLTESKLLKFGLFKCTDVAGAFEAAAQIIVDYASGASKISQVGLENSKSSLAYGIISGTSTKLSAAMNAWVNNYDGKQVDYDQWLLSKIALVEEQDVMHALITYLVPIFDPKSNLAITTPTNKAEDIGKYFEQRGWSKVEIVAEDKLSTYFAGDEPNDGSKENTSLPDYVAGVSMFEPGAFAAQFKCLCPKCG